MSVQMKNVLLLTSFCLLTFSTGVYAQKDLALDLDSGSQELANPFGDGTPAANQALIRHEATSHCNDDGLCKIYGVKTETETHWELTLSLGEGIQNNSQQNVYYIGGGNPQGNNQNSRYASAVLKISGPQTCTTTIEIDTSVYRLIKTYMLNNIKSDGKSARDFTEAEKTVMMFYGKIIEKAATCQNNR